MPKTHLKAKAVDIGEVELGDRLFLIVEIDVDEERKKNTKTGTTETLYGDVKDVLRLTGALPTELVAELRRQRRAAEESSAGIAIIPGLEGMLDGSGVVVTEADAVTPPPKTDAPAEDDGGVAGWLELGATVHDLRARIADEPEDATRHQVTLDGLFTTLNAIEQGDEVIDDDGDLIIIDIECEVRPALELPDFDIEPAAEPAGGGALPGLEAEPFAGYDGLDFDGIVTHVDDYLAADKALGAGKPSTAALDYVAKTAIYEKNHGARGPIIKALEDRVADLADEVSGLADLEAEPPWPDYNGTTADGIILHLKEVAEADVEEARRLIGLTERYETAHKARKGILTRTGGIVPPPLPVGPDEDLKLGDELEDRLDELDDDEHDDDVEP